MIPPKDLNEKKLNILKVAEKHFAEKGFDGASIRAISKEANINVAMISYYFGSKESLLETLVYLKLSDLKNALENLTSENLNPIVKIEKLIDFYISKINANKGIFRIMHFEIAPKENEDRLKTFFDIKKSNLDYTTNIIKQGQDQNVFKKEINPPLLICTIVGTYFNFYLNKVFYEEILKLDTEEKFNNYISNELTTHIKQLIKALLVYEN